MVGGVVGCYLSGIHFIWTWRRDVAPSLRHFRTGLCSQTHRCYWFSSLFRGLFLLFSICCLHVQLAKGFCAPGKPLFPQGWLGQGCWAICGTGTAARQAIVEDCPHRVRLHPLLGDKKRLFCVATRVGEQGGVEGMRPMGLSLAQAFPSVLTCRVSWDPGAAATSGRGCMDNK